MRKVFLWSIVLARHEQTNFISDDFELPDKNYEYSMSYILDMNTESGDNLIIVTAVTNGLLAKENYRGFIEEAKSILTEKGTKFEFKTVTQNEKFEGHTINRFFKDIAHLIKDDDKIYADITFGIKPYTFSMFIAMAYAVRAAKNVSVETVVYALKYSGKSDRESNSKICDLTSLFYLNEIAGQMRAGDKAKADRMLDFLIMGE